MGKIKSFYLVCLTTVFASNALANETDFKQETVPDASCIQKSEGEFVDTSVEEEIEENDLQSYELTAKNLKAEEIRTRNEILRTKKRIQTVRALKDAGKAKADLALTELRLQKENLAQAKTELATRLREKTEVEKSLADLKGELAKSKKEHALALEEIRKLQIYKTMADDERREIVERTQQTRVESETLKLEAKSMEDDLKTYRRETAALNEKQAEN